MISHEYQCIFVEIPKTGSTSIRQMLGAPQKKAHMNICQIRYELQNYWTHYGGPKNHFMAAAYMLMSQDWREARGEELFARYFKFGFVRNPWDRVVSLYLRQQGLEMRDQLAFDEFVDWIKYSSSTSIHPTPHTNQLDWLVDASGELLVDFVGRFESLATDWTTAANRLHLPTELAHVNENPLNVNPYQTYYTPQTQAIIARKFAVDIEYFGYTFDG